MNRREPRREPTRRRRSGRTGAAEAAPAPGSTRERILDAAADVLNRKGYAGTRLGDIADLARLQAPTIYYYFPSREDLIQEVVQVGQRRVMARVEATLAELPPEAGPLDRIVAAVGAHLEVVLRESQYAAAAIRNAGQLPPSIREAQLLDQRRYGALWRGLVAAAVEAGEINPALDARAVRMLILGALNWAPEWWHADRGGGLGRTVATAQLFVRQGLAAP